MKENIWAIIPNRIEKKHQGWLLKTCLTSLFDYEPSMAGKVIVCDDESPEGAIVEEIVSKFPVKLMQHKDRASYSKMVNSGLKAAHINGASGLITINNDIEHKSPFLDKIESIVESDPKIGVIGAVLFYPDGRVQHSGVEVEDLGGPWCIDHWRGKQEWTPDRYCHAVTGAWKFINMKRMHFGYDEKFKLTFEDVDYCMRAWHAGSRVYLTTKIAHLHHESVTRGRKSVGPREIESAKLFRNKKYPFDLINEMIKDSNRLLTTADQTGKVLPLPQRG